MGLAWKFLNITLERITNVRTGDDPGPDLEIYGDLYISRMMNDGTRKIIETFRMWHRNSTDRIVLNEGDSLYVNNQKKIVTFSNQFIVLHGTSMYEHDTWPNPDDTFTDATEYLSFESIHTDDYHVSFMEDSTTKELFWAMYKIEVLDSGIGRVPSDIDNQL
ncbi:hypothetical protein ACIQXV_24735 [Neobacillus sp. NPDC097160]|uniref:hypothetical protein n=1 Tax=Neobacillus sp. NPDC097160 TaxID=3364298 RepID=UPI00381DF024